MDLSLIIPAYNEADRIGASLEKTLEWAAAQSFAVEVLVVDDGSRDNTVEVASRYAGEGIRVLAQPRNMGKGAAVRRGMLEAKGAYRIFTDADFSTPITEATRVLAELANCDVVIGSRAIDSSFIKEHQPWYRESMGKAFNLLVQLLAVPGIHDTQCGFKGFRARAAQELFSRTKIDGFGFDVEVLYLARRLSFGIKEIPVEWYNDPRSTLNPVADSLKMLGELLRVRRLHRDLDTTSHVGAAIEGQG
ncbi:MAG: glycosyltransferase family 2 protein [bacterium]|nr:glycosyltransferase family 2 protein [Candidatus Kapabacteria bacterium]